MTKKEFMDRYGGIYERSPWVAEQVWQQGLVSGQEAAIDLAQRMRDVVAVAARERQLELIRAHPDLGGKAAVRGELTRASRSEQASAGIDQCSPEEFNSFQRYNEAYKAKFQFPFVMAVKGSNRLEILKAFEQRLEHDYETEFSCALTEIHKIARLRFEVLADE